MDRSKIPIELIREKMTAEAERAKHRLERARDILQGPLDTEIGATPHDIVYQEDRVRLKHYRPEGAPRLKTPLLMAHALFNRENILDLQPDRSVVRHFLKEGVEVYLVDWGSPGPVDRYLTLDDHIEGYLNNIVDFILDRHGLPSLDLKGLCLGGTFSVMYAALHPEKVKNLITTVAPIDFDTDKGLLHIWLKEIDADRLVDAFGNLPGNLLTVAYLLLNPARMLFDKYIGFLENMDNKEFVENFIRMEKWIFDSPAVPGETLRQLLKDLYQQNLLIQGRMELGGVRLDLKRLTMPVMNIFAQYDHLVPPEACRPLTQHVGSRDTEDICLDTGHIGIYVGSQFQKELVPRIVGWLADRE
jgi:poly[(R)-3-hydroxyalkanoate] polymerase subunit PhaC